MRKYIYYCPKCKNRTEIHHGIGVIDSVKCKCGKKMKVEIQPTSFEVRGKYTEKTGYSDVRQED